MGPFDAWPTGRGGSSTSTASSAARRTSTRRRSTRTRCRSSPRPHGRGGLPLHRGHDRPRHRLDPPAEGADARQAVLRVLRAGCDPRAASRADGVVGQVQGSFRRRLGRAPRARSFARQKELGVIPPDAELTERPDEIPAWDDMPDGPEARARASDGGVRRLPRAHRPPRRSAARRARRPRGPGRHARLLRHRRQRRLGRGHAQRLFQRAGHLQRRDRARDARSSWSSRIDDFGTPDAYNHYAVGWAHAMDTPYQWTKQVASHWGGTRNGTIVHWPGGFDARGEIRSQFHHVIDVAPTVLEAAGLPASESVNGVEQIPIEGVSMAYSFDERRRGRSPHDAVLRDVLQPRHLPRGLDSRDPPLDPVGRDGEMPAFARRRLGAVRPGRLDAGHDLAADDAREAARAAGALFLSEATKYNVLPLDDRRFERFNPDLVGPPAARRGQLAAPVRRHGPPHRELRSSDSRTSRTPSRRRSTCPTAAPRASSSPRAVRSAARASTLKGGRPTYCYNLFGLQQFKVVRATMRSLPASTRCAWSSPTTAGGLGKGGARFAPVRRRRRRSVSGRVEATVPMLFSADETTDVGSDTATPVSDDYGSKDSEFTGTRPLGAARHRRGCRGSRPSDLARGAPADRNGAQ